MVLTRIFVCATLSFLLFHLDNAAAAEKTNWRNTGQTLYSDQNYHNDWNDSDKMNNHKPTFDKCPIIAPSIKEEQQSVFVYQVNAVDRDPPDRGGKITYSFIPAVNNQMKIDPDNGTITTVQKFNRDDPDRVQELYVIVRAVDNGKPQLDDVCQFKVIIEDINDNEPQFDKMEYRESIPQDTSVGSEVLRLSATDIDEGDNRAVNYDLLENGINNDRDYFWVDGETGSVKLKQSLTDKPVGYDFKLRASATDRNPIEPKSSRVNLIITVIESDKKPPYFTKVPPNPVKLMENFTDYSENIATLVAESNTGEKELNFIFVPGNSDEKNKKTTFRLETKGNTAHIRLSASSILDYETVPNYTLTVRVSNKHKLAAEHMFRIELIDVNDMQPRFSEEINEGTVLENEEIGTYIMQVSAFDGDVSYLFKKITYSLENHEDKFSIEPDTGIIRTKVKFDREGPDGSSYSLRVKAMDGAPSAVFKDLRPNSETKVFNIEIADKNDNPPTFLQKMYEAEIAENQDVPAKVIDVKAVDIDSAANITYSIERESNVNDAFIVLPETGEIRINQKLDYENIPEYTLKLIADDGIYKATCLVHVKVIDVNDNAPVFLNFISNLTVLEETMDYTCLTKIEATDPDTEKVKIIFSVLDDEPRKHLTIDDSGCLRMIMPFDREDPNGNPIWHVRILASDGLLRSQTSVTINLVDINDNAPYLDMPGPIIWYENQDVGVITTLIANDRDGPTNGGPFTFEMAGNASNDITNKFSILDSKLYARVKFDRESQKEYRIPIAITDRGSPPLTGVDYLIVIIGDENDNAMKDGSSSIMVYSLEGQNEMIKIGRVYVDDLDDWDIDDKSFDWDAGSKNPYFDVDSHGVISMLMSAPPQSYNLHFIVHEESEKNSIQYHSVNAVVNVTIKRIPREAVEKSGSIRFEGISDEDFIKKDLRGMSKADILKSKLAKALNNIEDNVDVFTVLRSPRHPMKKYLDVRFSAHGSPYYPSERINAAVTKHQQEIEDALGLKMLMINVDECLSEKVNCESSCWNKLTMKTEPAAVNTNLTSFIGIYAFVEPVCECRKRENMCSNGGSQLPDGRCQCDSASEEHYCETSIGFNGNGWALYPTIEMCSNIHIVLYAKTATSDGLIFYLGPDSEYPASSNVQDFVALQLHQGYPVLLVDYGSGTAIMKYQHKQVVDDMYHKFEIILDPVNIQLKIDNCDVGKCASSVPVGNHSLLNVNGPLQLGGSYMDLKKVSRNYHWIHRPSTDSFHGCIRNFTVNGYLYNLGAFSVHLNADSACSNVKAGSVVNMKFDWSFFTSIFICFLLFLLVLMFVVVHRRKVEIVFRDRDDICENIINYEDEGGGEGDTTYNLDMLRMYTDSMEYEKCGKAGTEVDETPDVSRFLDARKELIDKYVCSPFDDVRHYAYEGDGNTSGSLSSLISDSDDEDLNFDYLSNFRPKFRKLAEMYGNHSSDEDSD